MTKQLESSVEFLEHLNRKDPTDQKVIKELAEARAMLERAQRKTPHTSQYDRAGS